MWKADSRSNHGKHGEVAIASLDLIDNHADMGCEAENIWSRIVDQTKAFNLAGDMIGYCACSAYFSKLV